MRFSGHGHVRVYVHVHVCEIRHTEPIQNTIHESVLQPTHESCTLCLMIESLVSIGPSAFERINDIFLCTNQVDQDGASPFWLKRFWAETSSRVWLSIMVAERAC